MELKIVNLDQLKPAVKLRSEADRSLAELAASIDSRGVICPLIVRRDGGSYRVLDGRRRLAALKQNGGEPGQKAPVLVLKGDERVDLETALITNAVRADLDAWDLAETVNLLVNSYKRRAAEVAAMLGKTERYVDMLLSLFALDKSVLDALRDRRLTPAHARRLLKIDDPELREKALRQAIEGNLSVRDLEVLIGSLLDDADGEHGGAPMFRPTVYRASAGSRMRFEPRRRSIRIEINLTTADDLKSIIGELQARVKKLTAPRQAKAKSSAMPGWR